MTINEAKLISDVTAGPIKQIGNTFVEIIDEVASDITATIEIRTKRDKYVNYIQKSVANFSAFSANLLININSFFPLYITDTIEREQYISKLQISNNLRNKKLHSIRKKYVKPIRALATSNNGISLVADAGCGKTSIFRHIAYEIAKGEKVRGETKFPFFLPISTLFQENQTILEALENTFSWLKFETPKEVVKKLLDGGRLVFLLDGLDEVEEKYQIRIIKELEKIIITHPNNIYCISSRPYSLKISLNNFVKWEVKPLTFDERIKFIRNWFKNISNQQLDQNINMGEALIKIAQKKPEILDVGSNPFFLSIICENYFNSLDVHTNIKEMLQNCIDGVLGRWDRFRNVARSSKLNSFSIDQRKAIASYLAFILFANNKIVFTLEELHRTNFMSSVRKRYSGDLPELRELVVSFYNDFCILTERSPEYYSFTHLQIQEYLTAYFIWFQRGELNMADKLFKNDQYSNVLFFLVKMLSNADEFFLRIKKYIDFSDFNRTKKLIDVLNLNPDIEPSIYNEIVNKILSLVISIEKQSVRYIKFDIIDNYIEIIVFPKKAPNKKIIDAISILSAKTATQPKEIVAQLFPNKKENEFFGKVAVCISLFEELVKLILKHKENIRVIKKGNKTIIAELYTKGIRSIQGSSIVMKYD